MAISWKQSKLNLFAFKLNMLVQRTFWLFFTNWIWNLKIQFSRHPVLIIIVVTPLELSIEPYCDAMLWILSVKNHAQSSIDRALANGVPPMHNQAIPPPSLRRGVMRRWTMWAIISHISYQIPPEDCVYTQTPSYQTEPAPSVWCKGNRRIADKWFILRLPRWLLYRTRNFIKSNKKLAFRVEKSDEAFRTWILICECSWATKRLEILKLNF